MKRDVPEPLLSKKREGVMGALYALKKNTKNPQLNCQPKVSKLRVVALYVPRQKG